MAAPTENVDEDNFCMVEATVATGFEQTAREEVIEKLNLDVKCARGKLIIKTPISLVPKILKLGTIDNCRVVLKHIKGFNFPKDQAASLQKIRELVKDVDWTHGITAWKQVFSFEHPINTSHEDATGNVGISGTKDKETLQQKTRLRKPNKKGRGRDKKKNEKGAGRQKDKVDQKHENLKDSKKSSETKKYDNEAPKAKIQNETESNEDSQKDELPEDQASIPDTDDTPESDRQTEPEGAAAPAAIVSKEEREDTNASTRNTESPTKNADSLTFDSETQANDTDSPIKEVDSPAKEPDSPASAQDNDSPAKDNDSPAKDNDSPAKDTDSPIKEVDSPAKEPDSPASAQDNDSPAKDNDSPAKDNDSPAKDNDSPAKDNDSLAKDNDSPAKDNDSPAKDNDSAKDDSPAKDNDSPAKDNNFPAQDNDSPAQDTKSPAKEKTDIDPTKPKFRVTCNRTGEGHKFDSTNTASNFGGAIYNYFGWNVDLHNFDIEVILNIDWDEVTVCIALTKESLHRRLLTSFGMTTLRTTIAYNMLRLCEIMCGDVVCDPMCGSGSIPISASVSWPRAIHMCGELHEKALIKTYENLTSLNLKKKANKRRLVDLDMYQWDATNLPLRDGCVDVFITDLPFGRRHSRGMPNHKLYPMLLNELARVTRKETGRACFITEDKKCMVKIIQESRVWQRRKVLSINMGGINTGVYLLHRTNEDVEKKAVVNEGTPYRNKRPLSSTQNGETESHTDEPNSDLSKDIEAENKDTDSEADRKNTETSAQTSDNLPSTTDCSSQVSGTNISSSETSSQTLESGSPRKRAKIDISENGSQTIGVVQDSHTSSVEGHVQSDTETRSQMTETVHTTAETGSQIEHTISSTAESGIQAQIERQCSTKEVRTRSQSIGTPSFVSYTRSQSTETRQITADTGSQATPTRNTSTLTSSLSVKTASTGTDGGSLATESCTQASESKTVKVDTGLQATDEEPIPESSQESCLPEGHKASPVSYSAIKNNPLPSSNTSSISTKSQQLPTKSSIIPQTSVVEAIIEHSNNKDKDFLTKSVQQLKEESLHTSSDKSTDLKDELIQHSKPEEITTKEAENIEIPIKSLSSNTREAFPASAGHLIAHQSQPSIPDVDSLTAQSKDVKMEEKPYQEDSTKENKTTKRVENLKADAKHGSSVDLETCANEVESDVASSKILGEKNDNPVAPVEGTEKSENPEATDKEKGCLVL
ncbi:uncharacterized protein LOC126828015 [Patella vulgata]|uniref:uncharacterized protein LOC126828015 n=1 Tax=Patella vulgata TaxID=6465 RepID=UPI0024A7F7AA|nr:uncharacterized protein LOC126828015 [Patella vulgata]